MVNKLAKKAIVLWNIGLYLINDMSFFCFKKGKKKKKDKKSRRVKRVPYELGEWG